MTNDSDIQKSPITSRQYLSRQYLSRIEAFNNELYAIADEAKAYSADGMYLDADSAWKRFDRINADFVDFVNSFAVNRQ